jgi:hypothetical protein
VHRTLVANFVPMPALGWTATTQGGLVLAWPTNFPGVQLQETSEVPSVNWTMVSAPVVTVGTNNQVSINPEIGNRYFRLVRP